jgi:uncharacterized protein involved in type VI secretion and phage assembly
MKGVVVGLVADVDDPEGLGRIKVEYPWLGDGTESNWARLATPLAGPELGVWFLPEVGDEALVAFEMDDVRRPYILGFLWNGDAAAPSNEPAERIIHTVSGHKVTFNDASGDESITLEDASGVNKIVLNQDGISIESTGEISMKGQKVSITADTTMDLEAAAKLSASGNPVHLNP